MRHGATIRRFTAPLAVLAVLLIVPAADAVSLARQCRQACGDEIAACVAAGGRHLACKRQTLRRCRREGLAVCWGPAAGGNTTAPTARVPLPHLAHGDHHVPVSRIERSSGTGRDVPRGPLVKQRRPRSQRWDCSVRNRTQSTQRGSIPMPNLTGFGVERSPNATSIAQISGEGGGRRPRSDTSLIPTTRNHPALGDGSKGYSST